MSRVLEPSVGPADADRAVETYAGGPRRLHWTPVYAGSAVLHAGAIAAAVASPPAWPLCLAAVAGNHLLNASLAFFPANQWLGPTLARLPAALARRNAVALTFDDGPDPDHTPWLLDELDRHGARATFFCIGTRVRRYPHLAREMCARGHAVENHSYAHASTSGLWGPGRWAADIAAAQDAIADATGVLPRFFRPPFGVRTPLLEPALARTGVHCVTWSARAYDTVARDSARVLARLAPQLDAGAIVLLHDGVATARRRRPSVLPEVAPSVLALLAERGWHSVTLRAACAE